MATSATNWLVPAACVTLGVLVGGMVPAIAEYYKDKQPKKPEAPALPAVVPSFLSAAQTHHIPADAIALVTGVAPGTMGEGIAPELAALGCSIVAVAPPPH
jgi:hypothetical protein